MFISEIMILMAAFAGNYYVLAGALLLFLAIVFGAFIHYFGGMLFGKLPKDMTVRGEPLSGKLAFIFLFVQVLVAGIAAWFIKDRLIWVVQGLFRN
jgi:formate hydrogenlyase subunit 3/multisubunit Na+/H+ antiporter MnhD subunit